MRFLSGLLVGALLGVSLGYIRWHEPFDRYARDRWAILNRADDVPPGGAVLIGDSIVQRLYLRELCGLPVFNAGMAGARSDQVAPMVAPLITKLRPRVVVIAAGVNDKLQGRQPLRGFEPEGAIVIGRDVQLPDQLLDDGVHLDARGRAELKRRLEAACPKNV